MSKRRTKNESFENLKRVANDVEAVGAMDVVMADAQAESVENEKHAEEVKNELDKKTTEIKTDNPDEGNQPETKYTAKLVLDEAVDDFELSDGRSSKVYDNDEDPYLDYDMFDFVYNIFVAQSEYRPLNPIGKELKTFLYAGSDDYINTQENNGHSQVGVSGASIDFYSNNPSDFDGVRKICDMYKFTYHGPKERRNSQNLWKYSITVDVPQAGNGYPAMVEDYFETLGMTLEDVMPASWVKQYRKKQARIQKEVDARLNDHQVERLVRKSITNAAKDNTEPLQTYLSELYKQLDAAGLIYQKSKIKKAFMDAFSDDDVEE